MAEIASESGHWYAADGSPAYTIVGKNGNERAVTLRDARKHNLFPSVTTITKTLAAPGLEIWKQNQILMAAMTLPFIQGESLDEYAKRVKTDAAEQGRAAAQRGTDIHGAIEKSFNFHVDAEFAPYVEAARAEIEKLGDNWSPEKSFSSPLGYGGKVDLHNSEWVIDFKTKEFTSEVSADKLVYPEMAYQLAAYREGLGIPNAKCANVFISATEPGLAVTYVWPEEEISRGFNIFKHVLSVWQLTKNYAPEV